MRFSLSMGLKILLFFLVLFKQNVDLQIGVLMGHESALANQISQSQFKETAVLVQLINHSDMFSFLFF